MVSTSRPHHGTLLLLLLTSKVAATVLGGSLDVFGTRPTGDAADLVLVASRSRASVADGMSAAIRPSIDCVGEHRSGGYLNVIGQESILAQGADSIAVLYPKLDPEICRHCTRGSRIFPQCHVALPGGRPRATDDVSSASATIGARAANSQCCAATRTC